MYTINSPASGNIALESVKPGHYIWRLDDKHQRHIINVVDHGYGLQMRRFDGTFSEALYGEFMARIDF